MATNYEEGIRAIEAFGKHVRQYESHFAHSGKQPKKQDWRPHRFCVRDVVLALVAIRYNLNKGLTDVDLFATYDPEVFEDYAGTKVAAIFILSEAFMSGGSMEIHFTQNFGSQSVRVPPALYTLALREEIKLKQPKEGIISSAEAERLYFALTDLSPVARSKAVELHNQGKVGLARTCFMVNNQTWLPEEMEMILTGAKSPEKVILGTTDPLERDQFLMDLFQASAPLLGTMFTKKLLQKEVTTPTGDAIDFEADEKRLTVGFDPCFYAKTYDLMEEIEIPWIEDEPNAKLPAGTKVSIMVRPRSAGHINLFGSSDLEMAAKMAEANKKPGNWLGILFPEDFHFLDAKVKSTFLTKAKKLNLHVIVCPEILENIDGIAIEKLNRSRIIRR